MFITHRCAIFIYDTKSQNNVHLGADTPGHILLSEIRHTNLTKNQTLH